MRKRTMLSVLLCLCLLCGCVARADEQEIAQRFLTAFVEGRNEDAHALLNEAMAQALPRAQFDAIMTQLTMMGGAYQGMGETEGVAVEGMKTFITPLHFARLTLSATVTVDAGSVAGFYVHASDIPSESSVPLPGGVVEEDINFGEDWVLPGTLTRPAAAEGKLPAVVLVHGSGPNDRDETFGEVKPFRDLAYGLAEAGIVVLRYDKRTYAYGKELAALGTEDLTVWEETVEDAILAGQRLRDLEYVDPDRIFLVGHSMGAMLAPRIQAQGGAYAALVMLAGSPRQLWEIQEDQNLALLADMPEADQKQMQELIAQERANAEAITAGELADVQGLTAFGLPARYVWDLAQYDAAALAREAGVPLLVLQGGLDSQVYAETDYALWQEALADTEQAELRLYPELGHAFTTEQEPSNRVDARVIADIAAFIREH